MEEIEVENDDGKGYFTQNVVHTVYGLKDHLVHTYQYKVEGEPSGDVQDLIKYYEERFSEGVEEFQSFSSAMEFHADTWLDDWMTHYNDDNSYYYSSWGWGNSTSFGYGIGYSPMDYEVLASNFCNIFEAKIFGDEANEDNLDGWDEGPTTSFDEATGAYVVDGSIAYWDPLTATVKFDESGRLVAFTFFDTFVGDGTAKMYCYVVYGNAEDFDIPTDEE